MATAYAPEVKESAKKLYLRQFKPREIATQLGMASPRVVYNWIKKDGWRHLPGHETLEETYSRRICSLVDKEHKTDADFKELDQLQKGLLSHQDVIFKKTRIEKERLVIAKVKAGDVSESINGARGGASKRGAKFKNDVSSITPAMLDKVRNSLFFKYQLRWHKNRLQRTRWILKSRQIGATFYFAWEAFETAVLTGESAVFLSASRKQAQIFKAYILAFAQQYFDIKLSGDPIVLYNSNKKISGANLTFGSTNPRTAQGFNGHQYYDEVFWTPNFVEFNKLSSPMSAHKKYRKTYFSVPSTSDHGAHPFWSGERFKTHNKRNASAVFDLSHKTLRQGDVGPDQVWRNIVTIKDAINDGCNLFNLEELRNDYTQAEFDNLFMCKFITAGLSVFKLADLMACQADNVIWVDFKEKKQRPFGKKKVWLGYDPARNGDKSTVVIVAPPDKQNGRFRILEVIHLNGAWANQANRIKELDKKYNIAFMGIDSTGVGNGVFEKVQEFYPRAQSIHYSVQSKTQLVLKAQEVIESRRLQWRPTATDTGRPSNEIAQAFLQIHQVTTSNDRVTYKADRNSNSGHADVAWAIMHALSNEPFVKKRSGTSVAFSA